MFTKAQLLSGCTRSFCTGGGGGGGRFLSGVQSRSIGNDVDCSSYKGFPRIAVDSTDESCNAINLKPMLDLRRVCGDLEPSLGSIVYSPYSSQKLIN